MRPEFDVMMSWNIIHNAGGRNFARTCLSDNLLKATKFINLNALSLFQFTPHDFQKLINDDLGLIFLNAGFFSNHSNHF